MGSELIFALEQIEREKGINKERLIEAIEAALISAFKKNFGSSQSVRVFVDRISGDIKVFNLKKAVENPNADANEISLEEARKISGEYELDDMVEIEITPRKFGRIAAQTAKQVVVQRIREAEREIIYDEFSNREGDIVTGIIQRIERRNVIIDLGKVEAVLVPSEQVNVEEYRFNERIKAYILEVKKTTKGPQVMVSRTHPGLVKRLFEMEVPEIYQGVVEIRSISREPGSRTKIAVFSREHDVDPVGACVGQRGTRVQAIVEELRGEKIDIIKWSGNIAEYISSSLSPAKVTRVDIHEVGKSAKVIVPDYQLSLAIGKEGQNARLAAKLTGWKIDIKSESQALANIASLLDGSRKAQDELQEGTDIEDIEDVEDEADVFDEE